MENDNIESYVPDINDSWDNLTYDNSTLPYINTSIFLHFVILCLIFVFG